MKNNRRTVENRQARILSLVLNRGEISVEELSELCQVSPMTVRRDLKLLDAAGQLHRLHGRAVAPEQVQKNVNADLTIRLCRDALSKYAAELVDDGDSLFINGSRIALNLLHYLGEKKVSVHTNNGWAVEEDFPSQVSIHLIGGELCRKIMIGEYVIQNLLNMSADKTFLGCGAVYNDGEFRYDIPTEIGINEIMISRTRGELFILADHSKLQKRGGHSNAYGSFRYNYAVTLITDTLADQEILRQLTAHDIRIIQVPVTL